MKFEFQMHNSRFDTPEENVDIIGVFEAWVDNVVKERWNIYRYINGDYCIEDEYGWFPARRPDFWFDIPSLDNIYAVYEKEEQNGGVK